MLFDPKTVLPEGIEILHKNTHTQWTEGHILFIQPAKSLKFEDEQSLFTFGWKKQDNIWIYNLVQAYVTGGHNE